MASVAALAALDPQLSPDGAALVTLEVGNHRQALCWAALVTLVAPDTASLAALGLQLAPAGVALVALQWVWPELWLDPQQTSGEAAPLVSVVSVAAQEPQLTPDGAALVALVVGNHRQALCWATLVTLVDLGRLHRGCLQHRCHL